MSFNRRDFLKISSLASASLFVPRFLNAMTRQQQLLPAGDKILIVLQLNGGNDGLNTVIPVYNDIYYRARPSLGIAKDKAMLLTDEAGLHPELPFFKTLYDEGSLAILNSVGYPNPDRSHFRSMDIWQSASDSSDVWSTGWLGRYLDAQCNNCNPPTMALEIDDTLSLALKGNMEKAIAVRDPRLLYNNSNRQYLKDLAAAHTAPHTHEEQPVDYLYKVMSGSLNSASYILEQSKAKPTAAAYPATALGKNLKTISSLILSGTNTRVYYLSIGSFDTHVNQEGQQARLFRQINEALEVFIGDMKANQRFNDVLLFTFSEFGRRVAQNASNGTDHGTANNMFFIGGGLKQQGILNALPDLGALEHGDLQYQVDFKDVYATVLSKWLGADDRLVMGRPNSLLSFI